MNFKRNLLSIITLVGSVFLVAGCKDKNAFSRFEFLDPQADLHQDVDTYEDEDHTSYIKYGSYDNYNAKGSGNNIIDIGDTYNVLSKYAGQHILKSTGDRNILVIPVEFSDFTLDDLGVKKADYLNNLEKAFFGVSYNNKFLSVSEYYNRSSYGKLRISGTVCPTLYTFPKTVDSIVKGDLSDQVVRNIYDNVISWYKSSYPNENLDQYRINPEDQNSDVAIYLVYTYPTELKQNQKVFWNYTFLDKPFSWSSYSCLNTLAGAPDAHTLIHECGHLFGLPDYYPTNESDVDPTGRIDMMDCSVGDHTGLSKMMLNWARPYYVKDTCEITIRSLATHGDLILINDSWNNPEVSGKSRKTVFDEYYLIELYSPTGINYFDASVGNNKAKLPLLPGIKIYHVDARIGYFKTDRNAKTFLHYCDTTVDTPEDPKPGNIGLAHTNSSTYTIVNQPTYNLYELQLNNVKSLSDQCASDENLFHKGDIFEITSDKFNTVTNTNYRISVESLDYRQATLKIEKINTTQN